jgi:hypothetical protein
VSETDLHIQVAGFLHSTLGPDCLWTSIGHGGFKLPIKVAVRLKAMGVRPGIPDIAFFPRNRPAHFIELKMPGKYPEPHQRELHAILRGLGSPVAVCRSVDEVEGTLRAWCIPMRGRIAA